MSKSFERNPRPQIPYVGSSMTPEERKVHRLSQVDYQLLSALKDVGVENTEGIAHIIRRHKEMGGSITDIKVAVEHLHYTGDWTMFDLISFAKISGIRSVKQLINREVDTNRSRYSHFLEDVAEMNGER